MFKLLACVMIFLLYLLIPLNLFGITKIVDYSEQYVNKQKESNQSFKRIYLFQCLLFFILWIGSSFIWYLMIKLSELIYFLSYDDMLYTDQQEMIVWIIPAIFLGLFTAYIISVHMVKYYLGDDFLDYIAYNNTVFGFPAIQYMRQLSMIMIPICFLLTITFMNDYTLFTKDRIIINEFKTINEKHYQYSDIKTIYQVQQIKLPSGEIERNQHAVLIFRDGTVWDSRDKGDITIQLNYGGLAYIQYQSKKEIETMQYLE